jgi:predicted lipoprotein with Yx(FWY)xxD motif
MTMRNPKVVIEGIGLAVLATAGGITVASASGSPSTPATASMSGTATVHTASASVAGKTETILVDSRGLPLYFYRPDTATRSFVTGSPAQLWPPPTATAAAEPGLSGKLAPLDDVDGRQRTYNGHPLYTFADDQAGNVTGHGVRDFFVATPGLAPIAGSAGSAGAAATVPSRGRGY